MNEKPAIPSATSVIPPVSTMPGPTRLDRRPAKVEARAIAAVIGRNATPVLIGE